MDPVQRRANRTRILIGGLSLFALLFVTLLLGVSCNKPDTQQNPAAATPTPTPNPSLSPSSLPTSGDTPIIVKGGGSIDLDFDDNVFTGGTPSCTNCRITRVDLEQIKDKGQPISTPVLTPCPFTGPATVKILTKGGGDNITVSTIAGPGVVINYNSVNYPGVVTECGDPVKHHSEGEIENVTVNDNPCGGCTKWKRCKVHIHIF